MANYLKNELIALIQADSTIFDFIQEFALDGFWFWDAKTHSDCWVNPKLASILGYHTDTEYNILQNQWLDIFKEKELSLLSSNNHNTICYVDAITTYYVHKDGSIINMSCSLKHIYDADGNISKILGANTLQHDVSPPQKADNNFHTSIGESIINSEFLYVVKTDLYGNYTYINDYFHRVFSVDKTAILGTNRLLSIIEEDRAICQETVLKCFLYPSKPFKVILRKKNKQQEIITNQWEFTGLINDEGKTIEILCIGHNVSELIKTENDLSILVSNMTDLLISVNHLGIITFVSPNVTTLYQYDIDEILGKLYLDFVLDEDIAPALQAVRKTIATGIPFVNLEIRLKRKDGSWYWTSINSSIHPYNKETILVINDITAKVDSLNQLKQTKELLEEVSEVANIGGWEYFPASKILFWSDTTRKIYDLPSEFSPDLKKILKFFKTKSKKTFLMALKKGIQKGITSNLELEIITARQRHIWLRSIIKTDFVNGVCTRVYGTFQDINQLKKSEIAREKSSKLLERLAKQVPVTLYQFQLFDDNRYFFSYVSRQLIYSQGLEKLNPEERTKALFKLIHPEDYAMVMEEIQKTYKTLALTDIEFRVILPSQKERWLKATSTPERLSDSVIWHGYMSDITDRKIAEEELKQTRNVLQETNQVARIGGWEADINTNIASWSQITREIHEFDEDATTVNVSDGISHYKEGYSREKIKKVFSDCIQFETPFDVQVQLITAKNREIWVRVIGKADFSIPTKKRIYGTFQDITDIKLAEEQLKRTRDLLEESNRVARVGGWSIDVASNTIYLSKVIKEIADIPYNLQPTIEESLLFYKEGISRQLITNAVHNCIQLGTAFEIEVQIVNAQHEGTWVKVIGKAELEGEKVKRVYGIFQDINQYKIAEQNAKNLQKLEVLLTKEKQLNLLKSRFISLTSHEFRTPLAGILGSADLLTLYVEKVGNEFIKNKIQEHINHITSQVDRLTGIVADVLTLEKTAEGKIIVKLKAIAIKAFLEKLTKELYINLREDRKLTMILPEEEKEILTDESLLLHIMNNLISNAFKYSRGVNKSPEVQLLYNEHCFIIIVKDYGMGIPSKDQQHLFETFFRATNVISTEGTGLGLSIAKEFTEKLGGTIDFESEEGVGSIFTLKLPY